MNIWGTIEEVEEKEGDEETREDEEARGDEETREDEKEGEAGREDGIEVPEAKGAGAEGGTPPFDCTIFKMLTIIVVSCWFWVFKSRT